MQRNISSKLLAWKDQYNRKPLIVRGARQVGKSWSISAFGKEFFEGKLHVINLEKRVDWHSIFEKNLDVLRILSELEIALNARIEVGKDLLFLDEIQACPKAISALRYFYEQVPDLHIIAAGSLLEFALEDIPFPVGRVQMMNMYPMSFAEFLRALSKERLAEIVESPPMEQADFVHNALQEELKGRNWILSQIMKINRRLLILQILSQIHKSNEFTFY